jgi:hypothetical protein
MPCFQLYPRIIRNAETGTKIGETEEKVRFLDSVLEEKRGSWPTQSRSGPSAPFVTTVRKGFQTASSERFNTTHHSLQRFASNIVITTSEFKLKHYKPGLFRESNIV